MRTFSLAFISWAIVLLMATCLFGDGQKRIMIVDSPEVLKGLEPFTVIVESANADALKSVAIDLLKEGGLPVVSNEQAMRTKGKACLIIRAKIFGDAATISLSLNEVVCLKRDANAEVIGASTYSDSFFGLHNNNQEILAEAFERIINKFVKEYRSQN